MATLNNHKNMSQKNLTLPEQLESLLLERMSLQIEIDRPEKQKEAALAEIEFGKRYWCMNADEKRSVRDRWCDHCYHNFVIQINPDSAFMVFANIEIIRIKNENPEFSNQDVKFELDIRWNDLHDDKKNEYYERAGDFNHREPCYIVFPGETEMFSSLFGMCECMWQRYVARSYHPGYPYPFDIAQHKMENIQKKISDIEKKIEVNEKRRKIVELEKISRVVSVTDEHETGLQEQDEKGL